MKNQIGRMHKEDLLDLFDRELRIEVTIPGVKKDVYPGLVRFTRPVSGMNYVLYSRLPLQELDKAIEAQVAHFSLIPQPFTWHVYEHDQPRVLGTRLLAHGFERDAEADVILIKDLTHTPINRGEGSGIEVRRISSANELRDVASIEQACSGGDFRWLIPRLLLQMGVPGYQSVYLAIVNDIPVGTAWVIFPPESQFASLNGGATLPDFRGRGVYSAILSARLDEAAQRGRQFAVVGAGEMSRPILLRRGFRYLTTSYDYILRK